MPKFPPFLVLPLLLLTPFALQAQPPQVPPALQLPALPVTAERLEGEVLQVRGGSTVLIERGQLIEPGTQVRTSIGGRVELSVSGSPTVALGNGGELSLDAIDEPTLRMTLSRGAIHVDARTAGDRPQRDLRIQLGELSLRVNGAEVWAALNNEIAQVCLISGMAEAQLPSRTDRLELTGQCLSRAGLESRWVMVPAEVLNERTALLHVRVRDSIVAQPGLSEPRKSFPPVDPGMKPGPTEVATMPAGATVQIGPPTAPTPVKPPPAVATASPSPYPAGPSTPPPTAAVVVVKPEALEPATPSARVPVAVSVPAQAPPVSEAEHEVHWSVVLASLDSRDAAELEAARLRKQGVKVDVREYVRGGKRGYRVGHGRFDNRADAEAAFESLRQSHPKIFGWMANY